MTYPGTTHPARSPHSAERQRKGKPALPNKDKSNRNMLLSTVMGKAKKDQNNERNFVSK